MTSVAMCALSLIVGIKASPGFPFSQNQRASGGVGGPRRLANRERRGGGRCQGPCPLVKLAILQGMCAK
ncbi:hypothetical protein E2C01_033453 [Portunus trituberculatus]|uniref:Secreted protein n=1 Tax=Portunus trituberculatus TaxID=210409 RepID=A0A5B7EYQ4_PORTR|nr:hypothetical protein [Portunus trituberculatus]